MWCRHSDGARASHDFPGQPVMQRAGRVNRAVVCRARAIGPTPLGPRASPVGANTQPGPGSSPTPAKNRANPAHSATPKQHRSPARPQHPAARRPPHARSSSPMSAPPGPGISIRGTAVTGRQARPPGWAKQCHGHRRDAHDRCAARAIDSMPEDPAAGTHLEPGVPGRDPRRGPGMLTFAFPTQSGTPPGRRTPCHSPRPACRASGGPAGMIGSAAAAKAEP